MPVACCFRREIVATILFEYVFIFGSLTKMAETPSVDSPTIKMVS